MSKTYVANSDSLKERLERLSPVKRALLEKRLRESGANGSGLSDTIPRRQNSQIVPLSFSQERLWFLNQLEPESPAYNEHFAIRITGSLDINALQRTLNAIIQRHEILRTTFIMIGGRPMQQTADHLEINLPLTDLRAMNESSRDAEARRVIDETIYRPFVLSKDCALRPLLVQMNGDEFIFVLVSHHIAWDGWSSAIFWREFAILYKALSTGTSIDLPEPPIQYADFAIWQRNRLLGGNLKSQFSYWREQLRDVSTLRLSTDRPRPSSLSAYGAIQAFSLSKEVSAALKALSRNEGATLFMALLAACQTLLFRYSGQDDISVGSPIAGRNRREIGAVIGFFANTLVLRTDFTNNPTFRELLGRVRATCLNAYSHQDLPFEKIVAEFHPERRLNENPLFQVMFQLDSNPRKPLRLPGLPVEILDLGHPMSKFDLRLLMIDLGDSISGQMIYNTDLFDASTIERMVGHFKVLLDGIVAGPDQLISELPLLTESEKHQLLVEWNDTAADYPNDRSISQLFEAQAACTPDTVAVVFETQQLTYAELNDRANCLASYLQKQGVRAGDLIAICLERSVKLVIGLLGILKAGGAYVPLDASYPKKRLEFILEDASAGVVLTDSASLNSLPPARARVICLDRDWEEIAKEPRANPDCQSTADHLAYVIYTSGSTGVPKGVEVSHRGVMRLLFGVDYVRLDGAQTFLHLAPISFDAATFEVWGALLHGGKCVLYPGAMASPRELGQVLKKNQVDTLWLTAALFNTVIDQEAEVLADVKQLLVGGEALSVAHVRKALALLPNTEIINGYGPTESTTFTCCYRIPRELDDNLDSIPIGRPIGNTQVYILGADLTPVPIGMPGELYIGGDGLARGYLNRPDLTAEKFISNPFSNDPRARLYKTGDLACYLPDGNIEFLGRIDDQVKIRGYRIEMGEIEAVLAQHAAIQQAVVIAREDTPGNKHLVGYVVTTDGIVPSTHDLRSYVGQKLPDYMVPSAYVFLAALPLTPNGKLDRKALPAPDQTRPELDDAFIAPRTPIEEIIAVIWSEILKLDRVGIHDNFFHLGGHSLLATQVVSRIRDTLEIELALRMLFEAPTIEGLAEKVEQLANEQKHSQTVELMRIGREQYRV